VADLALRIEDDMPDAQPASLAPGPDALELNGAFAAFVGDAGSQAACRQLAAARGWPLGAVCTGSLDDIQPLLDAAMLPRLLVIDLDGAANAGAILAQLAQRSQDETAILAIGSTNDVALYRHLRAAGASDYLLKPFDGAALLAAAEEAARGPGRQRGSAATGDGEPEQGHLTLVTGVRGGCGASTLAVNLAWFLAHEQKRKTCLFDLDLHFGISSLALDLEPGFGLREALESPERMDALMLASSMVSESETLSVLAAEEPIEQSFRFDPAAVHALVDQLSDGFASVVVDLPRGLLSGQADLLARADAIVLVTDMSLVGIRDCGRVKAAIEASGSQARVMTLASRVGKDRPAQIDRATFERSLGGKLACVVPEDAKTIAACANAGKAIGAVAGTAPIAKVMRGLACELTGHAESSKAGLFGKLRRVAASL
jgi:pilus assembly protein CpaE